MPASRRDDFVSARGRAASLAAEVLAVMGFRGAIGFATGGDAQARVALGQREIRCTDQCHCYGNNRHDSLHCCLLLLDGHLAGTSASMNLATNQVPAS